MGQAKIRRAEIEELKANGPRLKQVRIPKNIVSFGAYYHDDQEDGIGVFLSESFEPAPGWTNITFHTLKDLVAVEMAKYLQMDREQQQKTRAFTWEILHKAIREYNLEVFGTEHRVIDSESKTTALTDTLIHTFVNVITNIWLLELMGEIKNDDHNGVIIEFKA